MENKIKTITDKPIHYKYNEGGFCWNCGYAATLTNPCIKINNWFPESGLKIPHARVCKACLTQMLEEWK